MDACSELARERSTLAKADADLRQGDRRVALQEALVAQIRSAGQDVQEAERLLRLLRETLEQWRQHRALIVQRVADLEARSAREGAGSGTFGQGSGTGTALATKRP